MIIICSSGLVDDVNKGLSAAKSQDYVVTGVLQVGKNLYSKLKKNQPLIPDYWDKRPKNYKINLKTNILHKKDCKAASGQLVDASIMNVTKTGFKKCKKCFKK